MWPFVAGLLTLPILVLQYRRYNRFIPWRAISAYLFILYLLALVSFTLYPMPDDPAVFCQDYALSPQLIPFNFISDIQSDGLRAVLQIAMNAVFFVPLGVFGRLLFRWRIATAILVSAIASLLIETAQLTGAFGLYPCSYRLFDVDDLLVNMLGGVAGYATARIVPSREIEKATKSAVVRRAGLVRHGVTLIIDSMFVWSIGVLLSLALYFVISKDIAIEYSPYLKVVVMAAVYGIIPYLYRGRSLGGYFTRLNHDDRPRSGLLRLLFYIARTVFLVLFVSPPLPWIPLVLVITVLLTWRLRKKLPYQLM